MKIYVKLLFLVPAVAAASATVKVVELNDTKPDFSRNVSIEHVKNQKLFGTMKIKQINPNSRPKINIYEEVQELFHFVRLKKNKDTSNFAA